MYNSDMILFVDVQPWGQFNYYERLYTKLPYPIRGTDSQGEEFYFNCYSHTTYYLGNFQGKTRVTPVVGRDRIPIESASGFCDDIRKAAKCSVLGLSDNWYYSTIVPDWVLDVYVLVPRPKLNEPNEKRSKNMTIPKQSHMLAMLQTNMTTIDVMFMDGTKRYTYMCPQAVADAFTKQLEAEYMAESGASEVYVNVTRSKGGFKVARVIEVHNEPQIDLDAPYKYKWIVSVVGTGWFNEQRQRDTEGLKTLSQAAKSKAVTDMIKALGLNGDSGLADQLRLTLSGGIEPTTTTIDEASGD